MTVPLRPQRAAVALLTAAAALSACAAPAIAAPVPTPEQSCPASLVELPSAPGSAAALPAPVPRLPADPLADPGLLVDVPPGTAEPPALPAGAWLVADLDTGEVLAACNADVPLAPASTLKVLTALALLPGLPADLVYAAGEATGQVEGSRAGIVVGSQYSRDHLAHGLWLSSGNDAAVALGELAGGQEAAVEDMNRTAARLGARSTVARNTSGLDAPGQVTTAHDLAVLGRAALRDPLVAGLAGTARYDFPAAGALDDPGRGSFEIQSTSRLARSYAGGTGLKNGYTRAAGGAYVGTADRDGRRYVATVLRSQGQPWEHARDLLDWAYATGTAATPVAVLSGPELPAALVARGAAPAPAPGPPLPSTVPPAGPAAAPATSEATPVPAWVWLQGVVAAVVVGAAVALGSRRAPASRRPGRPRGADTMAA